ncbi:hypothetical protein NDK47_23510 [Brevibacillus ruminantium]|uniref:Lipoprotein n=1 Tax=Brevibacillus ruminantium TaxID=2950604 RepID=A0ABY4WDY2_9BACL|nr:hypothetical protein [Brevibacillus ruminantium]USG65056.1 hypothetical protein NDK47_23510 [Brevibacillus ruminantium]
MKSKGLFITSCLAIALTGCTSNTTVPDQSLVKNASTPLVTNSGQQEGKQDLLTKDNATFLIEVLDNYAPPELDDSILNSKEPVYIWDWFRKLQVWTDDLTRLSSVKPNAESAVKDIVTSRLNKYFTKEQAETIFTSFFRTSQDGTFETFARERFEADLDAIDENLQVDIQEVDQKIVVKFTGIEYDYFNADNKQKHNLNIQFKLIKSGTQYLIEHIERD